jgi:hypothetical protein
MDDLRGAHYILSTQVIPNRQTRTIQIGQQRYINDMLKCFRMDDAKLCVLYFECRNEQQLLIQVELIKQCRDQVSRWENNWSQKETEG